MSSGRDVDPFKALLQWLNTPWRAAVFLVTLPLIALGWLLYSERALVDEYLRGIVSGTQINYDAFDAVSGDLLQIADIVILLAVDVGLNSQSVIRAVTATGPADIVGVETPFLDEGDTLDLVVDALRDRTICVDYADRLDEQLSEIGVWMTENGYMHVCGHKLPSGTDAVAAFITVGWSEQPSDRTLRVADIALTRASGELTE